MALRWTGVVAFAFVVAACGSSSEGSDLFGGGTGAAAGDAGAGGTATGCARGGDCSRCATCFDGCVCSGATPSDCLAACAGSGGGGTAGTGASGFGGSGGGSSGFGGSSGSAGSSGFGGSSGSAGSSGFGGSGGNGGTGGTAPSCSGDQQCSGVSVGVQLAGCCASGRCGYDLDPLFAGAGCVQRGQPGRRDPTCPAFDTGQGFTLPGCCKPGGVCGLLDQFLGLGCVDTEQFGQPGQSCNY